MQFGNMLFTDWKQPLSFRKVGDGTRIYPRGMKALDVVALFKSLLTEEPAPAPEVASPPTDRVDLSMEATLSLEAERADQPAWNRPTSLEQIVSLGRSRYGLGNGSQGATSTFAPPTVRAWGSPLALLR